MVRSTWDTLNLLRSRFLFVKRISFILLVLAFWGFVQAPLAKAAKPMWVKADEAVVYEGPGTREYRVVTRVPRATLLQAANFPTKDFYKVRTTDGEIGFVAVADLSEDKVEPLPPGVSAPPPPAPGSPPAGPPEGWDSTIKFDPKERNGNVMFRGVFGFDFFSLSDFNTRLGFDSLRTGMHFGFEIQVPIRLVIFHRPVFIYFGARVERIFKSVIGRDAQTGVNSFLFEATSNPVMGMMRADVFRSRWISVGLGLGLGAAIQTQMMTTALTLPDPRITLHQSTPFTLDGLLEVKFHPVKYIQLFVEGGYRYLTTPTLSPIATVNGTEIYQSNGTTIPLSLNFSGPVAAAGLSLML